MTKIYSNNVGIAFYWNRVNEDTTAKIQLVFKETGFNLTVPELEYFAQLIIESQSQIASCKDCKTYTNCRRFLLQTPAKQIDLAVSKQELTEIKDLVNGTLFLLKIQEHVYGLGRN
ncbi:DUF6686 family protein [Flavobacterium sp.]|uniref:DUF6686 family protein n=1 Tax=Flavobacterium sp. TaxID=239 RepID=UPI00262DC72D|nr:DUF6686 family protein [Flavobacterium sp.]MDD3005399.1 hypothetical protein [Flavobacterium sp.]